MSEIRDLVESYYNDVYIEEEVLDEQGRRTGSNPNVYTPPVSQGARRGAAPVASQGSPTSSVTSQRGKVAGSNQNVYTSPVSQGARRGAAPVPGSTKPQIGSLPPNARQVTQYPQGVSTGVGGGNAGASTGSNRPAPVARPLPAGAPNLGLTVTSPGAAKVAPSAAPAAKPAGSAMDQWRAANTKLAAAADEKARIRGTSQTDNPLMKDMRSKMSMTPSVQSPTLAKDLGKGSGNQSLLDNPNASKSATPKPAPKPPTATR